MSDAKREKRWLWLRVLIEEKAKKYYWRSFDDLLTDCGWRDEIKATEFGQRTPFLKKEGG